MIDLRQGDCLEIMKDIESGSIDAIITDPPYGTTSCKWDSVIPFDKMWEQLNRIIKPNGAIVLTASQPFTSSLIMSNPKMFKYCWVWEKSKGGNFVHAKYQPLKNHEDVVVFSKGGSAQGSKTPMVYNPQFVDGKPYDKGIGINTKVQLLSKGMTKKDTIELKNTTGKRYPKTVQKFVGDIKRSDKFHPTQKPVALMEYLIKTYTNETETVLDFTCGSGTTGVACKNLNRNFIGIELDEGYFNIAKERIDNHI